MALSYCNWRFIIYPESVKDNWVSIWKSYLFEFAVSPLHCRDFWTEEDPHFDPEKYAVGEQKKPHYHVIMHFGGKKSIKQIQEIAELIIPDMPEDYNGSREDYIRWIRPNIIPAVNFGKAVRYLVHADEDDTKAKYDKESIKVYNGFNVDFAFKLTKEQEADLTHQIRHFIRNNKIFEYSTLLDDLGDVPDTDPRYAEYSEMYLYSCKHTILINNYIKSYKYRMSPKKIEEKSGLPFDED